MYEKNFRGIALMSVFRLKNSRERTAARAAITVLHATLTSLLHVA